MKKTLYLMRHGQTLFNLKNMVQGACDSPLTELGKEQARQAAGLFDLAGVDHFFTSPQPRAVATMKEVTCCPFETAEGLREMNFGAMEGEPNSSMPPIAEYDTYFVKTGGESRDQVKARMRQTLTEIMDRPENHTVLAVSHGGALANFLEGLPGIPFRFPTLNCTVFTLEYDTDTKVFTVMDRRAPGEAA